MFYLLPVLALQSPTPVPTADVLIELAVGIVASFVLSYLKRRANQPGASPIKIKGAFAHTIVLIVAVLLAVGFRAILGELTGWGAVLRSMGVIAMSAMSTFHLLISKLRVLDQEDKN